MKKIVIAITGASGAIYAKTLLDKLIAMPAQIAEIGLVMSDNARQVWQYELGNSLYESYEKLSEHGVKVRFFEKNDFMAPFASGSGQYHAMIVVPCSMGTLSRVATGASTDLITRAADVMLKEQRKLILLIRETPYNYIHIKNMETVTLAGGIICPATPSFYSLPKSIEELAATVVDRVIQLADLQINTFSWGK